MIKRPRPCIVCGIRVEGGQTRCPAHLVGSGRMRSCLVCGTRSQGNYCPLHEPVVDEAERNARNPYRKAYKDKAYAVNRQHRFERAKGRCEACKVHVGVAEWQCDHVVDIKDGGTNDITNLRILCIPCHKTKTAATRGKMRLPERFLRIGYV